VELCPEIRKGLKLLGSNYRLIILEIELFATGINGGDILEGWKKSCYKEVSNYCTREKINVEKLLKKMD
jgi:hypothetical protein